MSIESRTRPDGISSISGDTAQVRGGVLARWVAVGGLTGAIAASSCCIAPLVLFSLGVSGAWIGNLTAMEPYRPLFLAITLALLGCGYWLVYRRSACDAACDKPPPRYLVKSALWVSTALTVLALSWNWIVPIIDPVLLRI